MNNLDLQYKELLRKIMEEGVDKSDRTGTGTRSIFGYTIQHSMDEGFPLLTTKKMYWKGIATELLWFLRGDTNIKFLIDNNCHIWDGDAYNAYVNSPEVKIPYSKEDFINKIKTDKEWEEKWGELGPIYGKQWRGWTTWTSNDLEDIDQIANLINDLKTNPDSRRLMVSAWNVGDISEMTLPPCHYGFQVYTRELSVKERMEIYFKQHSDWAMIGEHSFFDKHNIPTRAISLMWNQRSVDTFLGLPFNLASYGLLLRILGEIVNMKPEKLICNLGDCHIYSNHFDQAKELLSREPYPLPKLNINTEWWQTESGECGSGPIDSNAFLAGLEREEFINCLMEEDLQLVNYKCHPAIKAPLSN